MLIAGGEGLELLGRPRQERGRAFGSIEEFGEPVLERVAVLAARKGEQEVGRQRAVPVDGGEERHVGRTDGYALSERLRRREAQSAR
jgi:hypothetical protein